MSEHQEVQITIEELRAQIDEIDEELVYLLNKRAERALRIRALKPQARMGLFDPKREEEIFDRVTELNPGPMFSDDIRAIFATILRVSKEMRG